MAEPVADVEEGAVGGEFVAHGHMPVRKDEVVDRSRGDQLAGELNLMFCFALEL